MRKFNVTDTIDFFAFDKSFSSVVSNFVTKYLKKTEISIKYSNKIKKLEAKAFKLRNSLQSATNSDGHITKELEDVLNQIDTAKIEKAEHISKSATFVKSEADKVIIKTAKAWANGECSFNKVAEAINALFETYGVQIDIANTFFADIKNSIGKRLDAKSATTTECKSISSINANNVINMLYATLYESMVSVGTIKPAMIPSALREEYINKPKKKAEAKTKAKAKAKAKKEAEKNKSNMTVCNGIKSKK